MHTNVSGPNWRGSEYLHTRRTVWCDCSWTGLIPIWQVKDDAAHDRLLHCWTRVGGPSTEYCDSSYRTADIRHWCWKQLGQRTNLHI
jgi:hypothetical protein